MVFFNSPIKFVGFWVDKKNIWKKVDKFVKKLTKKYFSHGNSGILGPSPIFVSGVFHFHLLAAICNGIYLGGSGTCSHTLGAF